MIPDVPLGFDDSVRDRLREAALSKPAGRAVAVFDYDHTCIHGDIGELFSQFAVDQVLYRTDLDEFWDQVDPRDGRDEARRLAASIRGLSSGDEARAPLYEQYRAEMAALYHRLMAREGKAVAYAWAVLLHVGLTEAEMIEYSERCVAREWARPLGHEVLETIGGERIEYEVGIRRIAAVREIHQWLRACGYEVWIVSATNIWTVRTAARLMFGHDPNFAVGNSVTVRDGVLQAELVGAPLFREGKVAAIERVIGVRPAVVFGDSETDLSMMEWAESLAVLIERGDPVMRAAASRLDWAVQPQNALVLEGP